jgi:predicted secreted protein
MKTRKITTQVQPSSRDSISSWLDVLVSMVALPELQRDQIRDELEDHLRSRVDDLLITGIEEHEAIQQAVSELGETAELAKVVTQAHAHTTPRRRIMQTTLIAAALAGMSFGGFTMINSMSNSELPAAIPAYVEVENTQDALLTERVEQPANSITEVYSMTWADKQMVKEIASTLDEMVMLGGHYEGFSVRVVGAAMVINAVPEGHKKIKALLPEIRKVNDIAAHETKRRHEELIERVRAEFMMVRDQLVKVQRESHHVNVQMAMMNSQRKRSTEDDVIDELQQDMASLGSMQQELQLTEEEMVTRYEYLRIRLIETEYEELLSNSFNSATHERSYTELTKTSPANEAKTVYLVGEGLRAGAYSLQEGLGLRQLLIASGYDFGGILGEDRQKLVDSGVLAPTRSRVSLSRAGERSRSWSLEEVLTDDSMRIRLKAGDEILLMPGD